MKMNNVTILTFEFHLHSKVALCVFVIFCGTTSMHGIPLHNAKLDSNMGFRARIIALLNENMSTFLLTICSPTSKIYF